MNRIMTTGLASLLMVSAIVPAMTTPAEARNGGLIAGAIVGLTAGAIIASSSRANAEEHHRWRIRCDRWAYRCHRGDDRACYALDNNCR